MDTVTNTLDEVLQRLEKIEEFLGTLIEQKTIKDWYEIEEVAHLLGKAAYTVREWCRHGRINAKKKTSGRGRFLAWVISHDEVMRIQREGLIPQGQ